MNNALSEQDQITIPLPRIIDPDLASDIEKSSVYVSPDLASLRINELCDGVTIKLRAAADPVAVRDKVDRYLAAMLTKFRKIETKVHMRHDRSKQIPRTIDVFGEMQLRGWLFAHGQGQVSLSGPPLNLVRALDARFADIYRERFGAIDQSYPAMIRTEVLARCGYFEMHPNAVSFVTHIIEDFDELERFRQANTGHGALQLPSGANPFVTPHYCLNPAACFPCYEAYEGKKIGPAGHILTWTGRVFRYESQNITGLDRLWEFNVRELVFLGSDAFVMGKRGESMQIVTELAKEWDLDCYVETATDPFFATVYGAKTFWQQALDVKYEIRLGIEPAADGSPRSIAAGSINLHGPFFGERFKIADEVGGPISSGCVGFGLERWVLALFAQNGFDPANWPESLRDRVFC
jgi:seryl-tRNA synthetase